MGEYGPCGPCSEIYYDHGEEHATKGFSPKEGQDILDDESRYVEIWNLVFMQFEKTPDKGKIKLPNPSIDTGAGLERIAAIKQNRYWNYDTDIFDPIFSKLEEITGKKYSDPKYVSSMRIVADHIRSCTMLITDGVLPSNEGRGYVLRRIIRRAIRHLKELGAPKISFHKIVPAVFESLGDEYSENRHNSALAEKILTLEEKKFLETLDNGLKFLNEALKNDVNEKTKTLSGKSAFKLYDTYGFPLDLTESILREKELLLNIDEFNECMDIQKKASRKSWKGASNLDDAHFYSLHENHGETSFTGYKELETSATLIEVVPMGNCKGLLFDKTPFYGESGGQTGDSGIVYGDEGKVPLAKINDTQKPLPSLSIHLTDDASNLEVGKKYTLSVNRENRNLTARNHTATHLLQAALIETLGDHVKQSGSLVSGDKLRFDFTHTQAVTKEELLTVSQIINEQISKSFQVSSSVMSKEEAAEKGALALFGEKYGDKVRVISIDDCSTELCGGTHVKETGEIGLFTIISEASLSTGIRRIEALTSKKALEYLQKRSGILEKVELLTNLKEDKAAKRVELVLLENKQKQKEINQLKEELQLKASEGIFNSPEQLKNKVPFKMAMAPEGSDLRKLSDQFLDRYPTGILFLYSLKEGGKFSALLRAPKKAPYSSSIHCSNILKEALKKVSGRGGGRPDMAQGSGEYSSVKDIELVGEIVKKLLLEALD
jgi:alanyl-tRNA synthetase